MHSNQLGRIVLHDDGVNSGALHIGVYSVFQAKTQCEGLALSFAGVPVRHQLRIAEIFRDENHVRQRDGLRAEQR